MYKTKKQGEKLKILRIRLDYHLDALNRKYGRKTYKWNGDPDFKEVRKIRNSIEEIQKEIKSGNDFYDPKKTRKDQRINYTSADSKTQLEREKNAINLINHDCGIDEIANRTRISKKDVIDIAKKHDLDLNPRFNYVFEPIDKSNPALYSATTNAIAVFLGFAKGTYITPIRLERMGYKPIKKETRWADVPEGSYFSNYADDIIWHKDDKRFIKCSASIKYNLKRSDRVGS